MEFESLYTRFLMPTVRGDNKGSKKRYAGLTEAPDGAKVIFKGMESVLVTLKRTGSHSGTDACSSTRINFPLS